ncbi:LamG-like jellyroll fold domain-containing protein [Nocardiopsis algeriensis]|uniref:LamG-like jellyroll fold domain-containing protein n=1 Tax=Nocardiopsis algeriensis TaxID=1478215 RepID=UPI003B43B663
MSTHGSSAMPRSRTSRLPRRLLASLSTVILITALGVALPITDTGGGDAAHAEEEPTAMTEAGAAELAAERGERVEVTGLREERRTVYADPDGTFTALEHVNPVRVMQNGEWVEPEAALVHREDGTITPRAATMGLSLSAGGDAPLATLTRAGKELSISWPGTLPEPELDGDEARYTSVLPDVDLIVRAEVDGFSHLLVVHTPEAAADPGLAELRLALETTGLEVTSGDEGALAAIDTGAGGTVFEAPQPLMWDSGTAAEDGAESSDTAAGDSVRLLTEDEGAPQQNGATADEDPEEGPLESSRISSVGVTLEEGALVLRPDQAMIGDEDTAYPLYIDPVWKTSTLSAWAMVSSGYSGTSFWKFSGKDHEGVGRCPQLSGDPFYCNGAGVKRLFYRIPTTAYHGRQILSAELAVTIYHSYNSTGYPVQAYRTGSFSSSTKWSNQPSWSQRQDTKSPTKPTASCTATNQNVRFDVSGAVGDAAANKWKTTSFGLRAGDESTHVQWKRFCDNAQLEVRYNTAPDTPQQSRLQMSPGGACIGGDKRPYVDEAPRLTAYLRDKDHSSSNTEKLKAQFRVFWTDASGAEQELTHTTSMKASGSYFHYQVPDSIPEGTVIAWIVRASDGHAWSPWSWDGAQTRCQFVYDSTAPEEPEIASEDFPADDEWHDGVGTYGTFTVSSDSSDVVEYRYGINKDPSPGNTLTPDADGRATLTWTPEHDGPHSLYVEAVDRAGKTSTRANHLFLVQSGRPAVGQWAMSEDETADAAADASGNGNTAAAGSGATFGIQGPGGTGSLAVALDGTSGAYLAPDAHLVDTTGLFSATAWARVDDLERDQAVLSQDGTGEPGFVLGYDASDRAWRLSFPEADMYALGEWGVSADAPVAEGQWTHLALVHDSHLNTSRLYVNGALSGTVTRDTVWPARGDVQIGRSVTRSGYERHLHGALSDVRVFDRIVTAEEIGALRALPVDRTGYWPFTTAADGTSPEAAGGAPMVLAGDASVHLSDPWTGDSALVGEGHLQLDGDEDHASAQAGTAHGSFTVSVRARLASAEPSRSMTVLSMPGEHHSLFDIRYGADSGRWEIELAHEDTDTPETTVLTAADTAPSSENRGDHLALVYDAFAREVRLYVNGAHAQTQPYSHAWTAPGPVSGGRALLGGEWEQYFSGALDDVRLYAGAADATLVSALSRTTETPEL